MSKITTRHSVKPSGKVGPSIVQATINVPMASDNLVCVVCGQPLGFCSYAILSHGTHKGLVAFACKGHVKDGLNFISKALDRPRVTGDVSLPSGQAN